MSIGRLPQVVVFHPGFIYKPRVFESYYYTFAHKGFPNEEKAISLLRKYIKWLRGFELLSKKLHIKDEYGRRISVYNLSDGQRIAVFMSLLYAISKPPMLFLIDTPEAFVHPDGLSIIADLIVHLVAEKNQVIIATQSVEFLEELLKRGEEHDILNKTLVERVALTKEGLVYAKGKWSGYASRNILRELGIDLRRLFIL